MAFSLKEKYKKEAVPVLVSKYSYKSSMQVPRLVKVVINRGIGEAVSNSKVVEYTAEQFAALTGQKPLLTKSKKSISNFKIREGQIIGCKVTLRSKKMYDFLTKLIKVALPKIRDFRGVPKHSFDDFGNYTLGLKDDTVFPEIPFEKVDKVRGLDITIVTTAKTKEEAYDLLETLGMPFRKN